MSDEELTIEDCPCCGSDRVKGVVFDSGSVGVLCRTCGLQMPVNRHQMAFVESVEDSYTQAMKVAVERWNRRDG